MKIDNDSIVLSSGRAIESCGGVVGIALDEGDSFFYTGSEGGEFTDHWTREERLEFANEMIARWRAWRDRP